MESEAEIRAALASITKALGGMVRELEQLAHEISERNEQFNGLRVRYETLREAAVQLRGLLPAPANGITPAAGESLFSDIPDNVAPTTGDGVRRILHEDVHRTWSVSELLAEFRRRGWLDENLKAPGPTIYQAAVRAAERGEGVSRTGKRFIALVTPGSVTEHRSEGTLVLVADSPKVRAFGD